MKKAENQDCRVESDFVKGNYKLLEYYYGFHLSLLCDTFIDFHSQIENGFDLLDKLVKSKFEDLSLLPDDIQIPVRLMDMQEFFQITDKYDFLENQEPIKYFLLMLTGIIPMCMDKYYNCDPATFTEDVTIYQEKKRIYEFLMAKKKPFKFENTKRTELTLVYGINQCKIDNTDNWLTKLIEDSLYKDFTWDGKKTEYVPLKEETKTVGATRKYHFIMYNTLLLLRDQFESEVKFSGAYCRFLLEYIKCFDVSFDLRNKTEDGVKDMFKGLERTYKGEPITPNRISY